MPEWKFVEDVFVPEYLKTITITVPNPARLINEIPKMMVEIFRKTGPDLYEDIIKWDVSDDPIDFYGTWRIRDVKDARSTMWGTVIIHGKQNKKDKNGNVTIWLRGSLITKIPYTTPIDKTIAWVYTKFFYAERRRAYLAKAKEHFDRLENELRATFGLVSRIPKVEMAS